MPLQNRVTPEGDIIATPARGTMLGIRGGCFHNDDKTLKARHWASKRWICCLLAFKGRRRPLMRPGHFTELFFLDEATALSAGHRPCFECRRADAERFAELWLATHRCEAKSGRASAGAMDDTLHRARVSRDGGRRFTAAATEHMPDGVFIRRADDRVPHLVWGDCIFPWTPAGYGPASARPRGQIPSFAAILTPLPTIAVMSRGYRPTIHPSAVAA